MGDKNHYKQVEAKYTVLSPLNSEYREGKEYGSTSLPRKRARTSRHLKAASMRRMSNKAISSRIKTGARTRVKMRITKMGLGTRLWNWIFIRDSADLIWMVGLLTVPVLSDPCFLRGCTGEVKIRP